MARLRGWVRRGLITPARDAGGACRFSFQDVTVLRRILELLEADVPTRKVHEALEAIRETLPAGRPLSAISVSAVGHRVLVHDERNVWEPSSGQLEMDFESGGDAPDPSAATPIRLRSADTRDGAPSGEAHEGTDRLEGADAWYDAGLDLEADERPEEAAGAYRKAIDLEPVHADAHLNLGRILHEAGRFDEAEHHYRSALATDARNARAAYNLGVLLEDRLQPAKARVAYEQALELDPDLAAAHFNLSRLLEREGRAADALGHLVRYRHLTERNVPSD